MENLVVTRCIEQLPANVNMGALWGFLRMLVNKRAAQLEISAALPVRNWEAMRRKITALPGAGVTEPESGQERVCPLLACLQGLAAPMNIEFDGKIVFWRGPAPWFFVIMPEEQSQDLKAISRFVTYGWGVIPVRVRIGNTGWQTSLFPKDGRYLVPIKASVRKAEKLEEGDTVTVRLEVHE